MDRSFLADKGVIEASRNFVCIRLASYEDAGEAEFLKTVFVGRSGELENTVFVLLSPDTKTNLCRPGRGPNFAFPTPAKLAAAMNKIAARYSADKNVENSNPALPQLKNFRLGLNVSACDGVPLLLCVGETASDVEQLKRQIAPLAFDKSLAGKFVYASATSGDDLNSVVGYESQSGILLIRPGEYGIEGKLEKVFAADISNNELQSELLRYANSFEKAPKRHHQHVRKGRDAGKTWKTEIPVTDPMSLRAMGRN